MELALGLGDILLEALGDKVTVDVRGIEGGGVSWEVRFEA